VVATVGVVAMVVEGKTAPAATGAKTLLATLQEPTEAPEVTEAEGAPPDEGAMPAPEARSS